jgi:hypothetical protein
MAKIWDEQFEATGYDETWSEGETIDDTNVLDEDFPALSYPGWKTDCLYAALTLNSNGANSFVAHDFGSDQAKLWGHFEFINIGFHATSDWVEIFRLEDGGGNPLLSFGREIVGGSSHTYARDWRDGTVRKNTVVTTGGPIVVDWKWDTDTDTFSYTVSGATSGVATSAGSITASAGQVMKLGAFGGAETTPVPILTRMYIDRFFVYDSDPQSISSSSSSQSSSSQSLSSSSSSTSSSSSSSSISLSSSSSSSSQSVSSSSSSSSQSSSSSSSAAPVLSAGLLAHYTFDGVNLSGGVAIDSTGNHDGTVNLVEQSKYKAVGTDAAYFPNVAQNRIDLGDHADFELNGNLKTIAFWIDQLTGAGGWDWIVAKGATVGTGDREWGIRIKSADLLAIMYDQGSSTRIRWSLYENFTTITDYQHVVVTFTGPTYNDPIKIWINSVEVSITESIGTSANVYTAFTEPCRVGQRYESGWRYLHGNLDDLRFYNRELTQGEINQLYAMEDVSSSSSSSVSSSSSTSVSSSSESSSSSSSSSLSSSSLSSSSSSSVSLSSSSFVIFVKFFI